MTERSRRGFAMITVLWLLAVASAMSASIAVTGRVSVETSRNRVNLDRAHWLALGCARMIQAASDDALRAASSPIEATKVWSRLPASLSNSTIDAGCEFALEAAGTRLDLNAATSEMLARLLAAASVDDAEAVVRSFEAWRAGSTFDDARQFFAVTATSGVAGLDSLLSAERGRVSLATAPTGVLMSVPGITAETADTIRHRAQSGLPIGDLSDVLPLLSEASRSELITRFSDAVQVTTPVPDAWLLRVAAHAGQPAVSVTLELRLARAGQQVVVTRLRILP